MPQENIQLFLPLLIFLARIVDVSIGTIRIIVVARGMKLLASILGFLEVFIWLVAISQIIQNLSSIEMYIFYAAGFACGTYVGMSIEQRLSFGTLMIRIVSPGNGISFYQYLIEKGYEVTHVDGKGRDGQVSVIFTVIKKNLLSSLVKAIKAYDPGAFYTIEDVRLAKNGADISASGLVRRSLLQPFYWFRKSK